MLVKVPGSTGGGRHSVFLLRVFNDGNADQTTPALGHVAARELLAFQSVGILDKLESQGAQPYGAAQRHSVPEARGPQRQLRGADPIGDRFRAPQRQPHELIADP